VASRNTRQRNAIRSAFDAAARPLGAQEVHELAQPAAPGLGIATVYRCIARLLEEGELVAVELPGGPPRYERAGLSHHHHFHCNSCGRVYDLPGCTGNIEQLIPRGFTLDRHEIVLYGACSACGT
jgi:Fur family ferric uptake transcriptional regulator